MKYTIFLLAAFLFISCDFKVSTKDNKSTEKKADPLSKIRNGILIEQKGLLVSQAFLVYEDGSLVPETNLVELKKELTVHLVIDTGFSVTEGHVRLGASEKVETNEGDQVLNEEDLFSGKDKVSATDAKLITLKVRIDQVAKLFDYYKVSFRVWDKNNQHEVRGSYKFNIQ